MTINIRSAKNVQAGIGRRFTCKRVDLMTSKRPFDLAQELWDFACEAPPASVGNGVPHVAGELSPYVREV